MKIQNEAPGRRIIAGKYDLGKGEAVDIPDDEWAAIVKCQAVQGMIEVGELVVDGVAPVSGPETASAPAAAPTEASLYDAPTEDKPKKRSKGS